MTYECALRRVSIRQEMSCILHDVNPVFVGQLFRPISQADHSVVSQKVIHDSDGLSERASRIYSERFGF